jgi:hypothetical protein
MGLNSKEFTIGLCELINKESIDSELNTPDFILTHFIIEQLHGLQTVIKGMDDYYKNRDDLMDGDAQSALASAGFGTDEDYGGTDERL